MSTGPAFSDSEYAGRLARMKDACAARGVSHALIYGTLNWYCDHAIRYLTNYDTPRAPCVLLLPSGGETPTLFIEDPEDLERARTVARGCQVACGDDFATAVAARLGKAAIGKGGIGVAGGECMGFAALDVMPRRLVAAIRQNCPAAELVDIGAELLAIRMIRSAGEIERIREAARIADIGAEVFLATVRAGVSERDLWTEIWYAMQRAGADDLHISLCRGPGSFWPHPASDAVFAPGDIVSIELSPRVNGYFSQANRMCFVGRPEREWNDLADLAAEALRIAIAAMRPGTVARDVVAQVSAFVAKSPLATMDVGGVHRIGHGCGISLDEGPFLTSASTVELRPSMTMACHPIIYLPYRHSLLMLGDNIRITAAGAEVLTRPQSVIPVV